VRCSAVTVDPSRLLPSLSVDDASIYGRPPLLAHAYTQLNLETNDHSATV
jgi:hypothetical protein